MTTIRKRKFSNVSRKDQRKEDRKNKKLKRIGQSVSSESKAKPEKKSKATNNKSTVKFSDTVNVKEFGSSDEEFEDFDGFQDSEEEEEGYSAGTSVDSTWDALKKLKEAKKGKNAVAKNPKQNKEIRIVKEEEVGAFSSDDELDSDDFEDFEDFDEDGDSGDDSGDANDTWAALKKLKEAKNKPSKSAAEDTMEQLRLAKENKKKLESATLESDKKEKSLKKEAKEKKQPKPAKKQGRSLADLLKNKSDTESNEGVQGSQSHSKKSKIPFEKIPKNATAEQIEQFQRDDEDIAFYSRMLGLKDPYGDLEKEEGDLDDGLETLLDGLNFDYGDYASNEEDDSEAEDEYSGDEEVPDLAELSDPEIEGHDSDSELEKIERLDTDSELESDDDFDDDSDEEPKRENPYVAPVPVQKYVPPSLRKAEETGLARSNLPQTEELNRLRRQIKGQINRLADTNIAGIVKTLSDMYLHHPRQYMNEIITNTVIESIALQGALSEKFLAVHAALVAALYRTSGLEFGAHFVQTLVEEFDKRFYKNGTTSNPSVSSDDSLVSNKESANLVSLLAELYSFNIVWCGIIYDFVRELLSNSNSNLLDENKTEILLKILRSAGSQLRTDDPRALRDIVVQLHELKANATQNGTPLSSRTMFMIGFIEDLKNNKQKKNGDVTELAKETRKRMRDFINANVKAAKRDPLRVSLDDIRNVATRGKWWLVGSAWRSKNMVGDDGNSLDAGHEESLDNSENYVDKHALKDILDSATPDWMELAKQQRMNTDIRRAIFVALMSSGDYVDAVDRLEKLKLRSKQEREIVHVLLHCCSMEPIYNPFYALVATRLCSTQRALAKTFSFSLYDFLGEVEGEDSDDEREGVGRLMDDAGEEDQDSDLDDGSGASKIIAMKQARKRATKAARQEERDSLLSPEEQTKKLRKVVHMAKLYGTLVANGVLPLTILKTSNMVAPAPDTTVFLDLFFTTLFSKVAANGGVGIPGAKSSRKKTSKMGVGFANAMFERRIDPESERGLVNLVAQTAGIGKKKKTRKNRQSNFDSDDDDTAAQSHSNDHDNEPGIGLLRKMVHYLPKVPESETVQEELEASIGISQKKSKKALEKKMEKLKQTKATIKWSVSLLVDAIQEILERDDKHRNSRF